MNEFPNKIEALKIKHFESLENYPSDPRQEGLRPGEKYAGGSPDEIIEIAGKKYKKEGGRWTEKEFYSHEGPGWDWRGGYLNRGWGIIDYDPRHLSDLPLYELVAIEE